MPRPTPTVEDLTQGVLARNTRAVGRALRWVDDRLPQADALLNALHPLGGHTHVIGVTGPPGAGKSTLVSALVHQYRAQEKTVAVLAVDPSSPYTGGAVLGDRIRMQKHFLDRGVLIRSIATRGHLGGLSISAADMVTVLDAAGFDVVILETVGVGQDELDISRVAHTTLLVVAPGLGDDVQAIKAGILEIADIFVVNKADRPGADAAVVNLQQMMALEAAVKKSNAPENNGDHHAHHHHAHGHHSASPPITETNKPVLKTIAIKGEGMAELCAACTEHTRHTADPRARARHLLHSLAHERLENWLHAHPQTTGPLIEAITQRTQSPRQALEPLWQALRKWVSQRFEP